MAQSGRFALSLRLLAVLVDEPDSMHTSAALAETLKTSPVMLRRLFAALSEAGFLVLRKGPTGGAKLKAHAKAIGLGDLFLAVEPGWMAGDKKLEPVTKRMRADAVKAMNETTLGMAHKRLKKAGGGVA